MFILCRFTKHSFLLIACCICKPWNAHAWLWIISTSLNGAWYLVFYHIPVTPPFFISSLIIRIEILRQFFRDLGSMFCQDCSHLAPNCFACRLLTIFLVYCINTLVIFIVCMSKVWQFDANTYGNWNKPTLFCSFHFSQKRAKKIEGDSIYIRHSLLMLEVCIPSGDVRL